MIFDFLFPVFFFLLLPVLWFIHEIKAVNFWLYLWQLKDYHIDRFIDHFRTSHGKKLLFDKIVFFKVALILVSVFGIPFVLDIFDPGDLLHLDVLFGFSAIGAIFLIYTLEGVKAARDFFGRSLHVPVSTKKIIVLRLFVSLVTLLWLASLLSPGLLFVGIHPILGMLLYDVLTPVIVSAVVLMVQPLAVLGRNRIIAQARKKRTQFTHLRVVGITGSYGKTSTKEILYTILSTRFSVAKTPEHRNSEIGIAQTLMQDVQEHHDIFICEMGAYNKGGIALLAGIAKPDIAILTGANEQHLATFGSMENLLSAEGGRELLQALPSEGIAIFNGSNAHTERAYRESTVRKKILCGLAGDMYAKDVSVEKERIHGALCTKKGECAQFTAQLLGGHNTENILLAAACARELGMSLQEIAAACSKLSSEYAPMKLRNGVNGLQIVDSTYSANPDGVMAALEYLAVWPGNPSMKLRVKKVIVMPCLIELGAASAKAHERIGKKIGEVCDLAVITTRDQFDSMRRAAMQAGMPRESMVFLENSREIFAKIQAFAKPGDVVLLESRVPGLLVDLLVYNREGAQLD